jgi:hypothetical protein
MSIIMKKVTTKKASTSSEQFEESIKLLGQAKKAVGTVPRLTGEDRRRSAKLRRGGHQVVPTIAAVATKYGIATTTTNGPALSAQLVRVQQLDSLLGAAIDTHATISDAHFGATGDMWTSARALYAVLKTVAKTDPSVAPELKSVEEWFRRNKSPATETTPTTATPVAATTTPSATAPVVTPAAAAVATAITPAVAVVPAVAVAPAH